MKLRDIKLTPLLDTLRLEKIDDATYFSASYKHYISNSRLGLLNPTQNGTPDAFFEGFKAGGFNQSFLLGTAVHSICLQSEYFEIAEDLGKPTAKLGAIADELYTVFVQRDVTIDDLIKASDKIEYYKDKIDKKRFNEVIIKCSPYWTARQKHELDLSKDKEIIYLDTKSREIALACIDAINNNKQAQALLHPKGVFEDPISANEQAILLDVEAECPNGKKVILHLKSKLDNYTIDTESNTICVNDIKTIGKIVSEIDSNIERFHYSRELGEICPFSK